jgi:hypothetical protein
LLVGTLCLVETWGSGFDLRYPSGRVPTSMRRVLSSMTRLQSRSLQSGCGGGGERGPNTCAFKPFAILPGSDCRIKQRKEISATSSSDNIASNMACGTFRSGRLMRVLMTFLSLSGSTDLDLSIVADGSITWSREWLQSGVDRSKGTSQCSNFACFLELSSNGDGTKRRTVTEITLGCDISIKREGLD